MDINIALALVFGILLMFYLTVRLIKSIAYKIKRKIFSGYGILKIFGLTGAVSTANFQLVSQAINHFWK